MSCKNCGGIRTSPWGRLVRSTSSLRKKNKVIIRTEFEQNNVQDVEEDMRPVKPWDLLNKDNWTMEEVRAKRLEICNACENLNALRQCTLCHCFMDMKTKLEGAFCPLRKW
jgi:hypothetical protein